MRRRLKKPNDQKNQGHRTNARGYLVAYYLSFSMAVEENEKVIMQEVDSEILQRARDWIEINALGTAYYYEVWDDPEDDASVQTFATSCPKSDEDPDSWVTVHSVSIVSCEVEERGVGSVLVKAEIILWKSDGSYSDGGEEEETEIYEEDATYHLRIWEDDIELEAID